MRAFLLALATFAGAVPLCSAAAETTPLTLDAAVRQALVNQPLLEAQSARSRAARNRALAAGALPDPQFVAGFENLSVDRPNPYSADADGMTMTVIGLMQEFPNAAKRRERVLREQRLAEGEDAVGARLHRDIARDTALAWLDVWQAEQALTLTQSLAAEARRSADASTIDLRSGRVAQDAVLAASIAQGLIADRERRLQQDADTARARLARWTGGDDVRIAGVPPAPPPLPPLEALDATLARHPDVRSAHAMAAVAETDLALARSAYRPDWRVQAMYGYRRPDDDMVSVQIGVDLPLFTANRQDRGYAAALAERDAATATRTDRLRELRALAVALLREADALDRRIADYDSVLLPAGRARVEAAMAAYRSGSGSLATVLDARTQALELQLTHLELRTDRQRRSIELDALLAGEAS